MSALYLKKYTKALPSHIDIFAENPQPPWKNPTWSKSLNSRKKYEQNMRIDNNIIAGQRSLHKKKGERKVEAQKS